MAEPEELEQSLVNLHRFLLTIDQEQEHSSPPLDEQEGIQLLQEILLGSFITDMERLQAKVEVLEQQVLDPTMGNALTELQAKIADQSALESLRQELSHLGEKQQNIPSELNHLKQRVENLEFQLHDGEKLMELILPLLNELIGRKVEEAGEEFARAAAPVLDEMVRWKINQDKPALGKAIAPLLPSAIGYQVHSSPGEFAAAIAPEMNLAIKEQVRENASAMIDALYPIMGNTIAKYIAEVLRNINAKLEQSMSLEGIARKIRARWQGISEAELILKESVIFQVQAVFLIQKLSGLIIAESKPKDSPPLEADMIAGMLTAIRGFVQECIMQQAELDRIEYGNSLIWLEGAGSAYIAVVLQGEPPSAYIDRVRRVMRILTLDYGDLLGSYEGNNWSIPGTVRELLDSLIVEAEKPPRSTKSLVIFASLLATILIGTWGLGQWYNQSRTKILTRTQTALATNPQLAVYQMQVLLKGDRIQLSGKLPNSYLKDLAQQTAQAVNPDHQIENNIIAVELPPDPLQTAAEIERLTRLWQQRPGITLTVERNSSLLTIKGIAPDRETIAAIGAGFTQIPGVTKVVNNLTEPPPKIDVQIFFAPSVTTLKPEDSLKIDQVKKILDRYPDYRLTIIGQTDGSGTMELNQKIALERAQSVEQALLRLNVDPDRLQVVSAPPPSTVRWNDRSVMFALTLDR